jgi:hypothetical protein
VARAAAVVQEAVARAVALHLLLLLRVLRVLRVLQDLLPREQEVLLG